MMVCLCSFVVRLVVVSTAIEARGLGPHWSDPAPPVGRKGLVSEQRPQGETSSRAVIEHAAATARMNHDLGIDIRSSLSSDASAGAFCALRASVCFTLCDHRHDQRTAGSCESLRVSTGVARDAPVVR